MAVTFLNRKCLTGNDLFSHSGGGFGDFLSALTAFLPIGLFLAAIPPNLITVST